MDLLTLARHTIPDTHERRTYRGDGNTDDIFDRIRLDLPMAAEQTARFSAELYSLCGGDTERILRRLYGFLVKNVPFELDPEGYQFIQKPSAMVHGRKRSADCKSYSLFIASVLSNLRIPYRFKFVSWDPYDKDVKHVFIEAFPEDVERRRVLDVNLKEYNKEKTPNYNHRFIDMTYIYSIGALPNKSKGYVKSDTIFDGLASRDISPAETKVRLMREAVRVERNRVAKSNGASVATEAYNDALDFLNDILSEISSITQTNDYSNARKRIAPIVYNYASGRYSLSGLRVSGIGALKMSATQYRKDCNITATDRLRNREALKAERIASLQNGTAKTFSDVGKVNASIGSFWGEVVDFLRKPLDKALDLKDNVTTWFEDLRTQTLQGVTPSKIREMDAWARSVRRETLDPMERKRLDEIVESNKRALPKIAEEMKLAASSIGKAFLAATIAPAGILSQENRDRIEVLWRGAYEDGLASLRKRLEIGLEPMAAAAVSLVTDLVPDAGQFFLYLFINDPGESLPQKVREKRENARSVRKKLMGPWAQLGLSLDVFDQCCRDGIKRQYGKSPEALVEEWRKAGKLDLKESGSVGIEPVSCVLAICAVISIISGVVQMIKDWDKDPSEYSAAPSASDWMANGLAYASMATGGTTSTGTAGDYSKYTQYSKSAMELLSKVQNTYSTVKANGAGTAESYKNYETIIQSLAQSSQGINNKVALLQGYSAELSALLTATPFEDMELETERLARIQDLKKYIADGNRELDDYANVIKTIENSQNNYLPLVVGGAAVLGAYFLFNRKKKG